jgi:hypothetical protein
MEVIIMLKAWIKSFTKGKDKRNSIEKRIDEIAERMKNYDEYSDDYRKMAESLSILTEANAKVKDSQKKWHLDRNVIFNGIVASVQIVIILIWEERHCIRTEAIKFVTKLVSKK